MKLKQWIHDFWNDESGIGVVEIILILVIIIGLVLLFKNEIETLINKAFTTIKSDSGDIIG